MMVSRQRILVRYCESDLVRKPTGIDRSKMKKPRSRRVLSVVPADLSTQQDCFRQLRNSPRSPRLQIHWTVVRGRSSPVDVRQVVSENRRCDSASFTCVGPVVSSSQSNSGWLDGETAVGLSGSSCSKHTAVHKSSHELHWDLRPS